MTIVTWLLVACSHAPQTRELLQQPPADLVLHKELADVPFFPQQAYQCGPAALVTVLQYQNIDVTAEMLVSKVYIPQRQGSLPIEMIATARSYGLLVHPLEPKLIDILREIAAGNPVLVFQNLGLNWAPQWHFAVVVGYDLPTRQLYLRSGTIKKHRLDLETFERTWQRADYWAQVMVTAGEIPATATGLSYTRAIHQLELAGFHQQALTAYHAGARRWPEDPLVLMALGNAKFENGDTEAAETVFRQVLDHHPDNASAWNNLAYVLNARQCGREAVAAIRCANKLKPENANIQSSVNEILSRAANDIGSCQAVVCPK